MHDSNVISCCVFPLWVCAKEHRPFDVTHHDDQSFFMTCARVASLSHAELMQESSADLFQNLDYGAFSRIIHFKGASVQVYISIFGILANTLEGFAM